MTALRQMTAILGSEFKMLFRNMTVLSLAVLLPLAMAAYLIFILGSSDFATTMGLYVAFVAPLSVYTTITTAVVARRQELFLKRLRASSTPPLAILFGIALPSAIVFLVQVAIVSVAFLALGGAEVPDALWLFVIGVLLYTLLNVAAGLLTTPFTQSAAAAQITVMPLFLIFIGSAIGWMFSRANEAFSWLAATPGGAFMQLTADTVEGTYTQWTCIAAVALVVFVVLGLVLSVRYMKWEKR